MTVQFDMIGGGDMAIDQRWFDYLKTHQSHEPVATAISMVQNDSTLGAWFSRLTGKTISEALL